MTAAEKPPEFDRPEFRRRRIENWMALGLLYAFFYMTRYNLSSQLSTLSKTFGWSNTQVGIFETTLPLFYGLSVFLNGPLADRIGGKKSFLFGAAGVIVMNFFFGLCTTLVVTPAVMEGKHVVTPAVLSHGFTATGALTLMAVIWGANGYFQSFGALSIVKVNAQWFHVRERGLFSGIFGMLIRFGLILGFYGVPQIVKHLGLAWGFWLPALCVAVLFLVNFLRMKDSPNDAGFGEMDTGDGSEQEEERPRLGFILKKVLSNPTAWTIAAASMMVGMVRKSNIDGWFGKYFADVHLPAGVAQADFGPYQLATWGIALMGVAGGFAFGISSDRVFNGRRAPVITFGFIGMAVTLALFGVADRAGTGPWVAAIFLAVLSFFINGAHGMIGGAASMDFGGRKAAATAAGLFDGMQYLASSIVGVGMGKVLDRWGWAAWQWVPIPFAVFGMLIIVRLWNVTPTRRSSH